MNPYAVLDVPRDADVDELKAAYRDAARATHPDKGGSAEAFDAVQKSWLVLRDPVRRRHYDATGQTDIPVDDQLGRAVNFLTQAFDHALGKSPGTGYKRLALTAVMERWVWDQLNSGKVAIRKVREDLDKWNELKDRLSFSDMGIDMLRRVLEDRAVACIAQIAAIERDMEALEVTQTLVAGYTYRKDSPPDYSQAVPPMPGLTYVSM